MLEVRPIASGSTGNCYLIGGDGRQLLIEAGIRFARIQQALDFQLDRLDGCLISHCHL